MQAVAEKGSPAVSPKVIVFRARMAAAPIPPPPETGQPRYNPPTHGNWAQWGAIVGALLIGITNIGTTWWFHHTESSAKSSDEHVNTVIDTKLKPAIDSINDHIDKKLEPINAKLDDLNTRVGKLEGRFEELDAEQKKLAKLQLDKLSAQIAIAQKSGKHFDAATVRALGNDLVSMASNPDKDIQQQAWHVTNRLISYYSFTNAEDSFVGMMEKYGAATLRGVHRTDECLVHHQAQTARIHFKGVIFENCTIHLDGETGDGNTFDTVLFRNVNILYRGGFLRLNTVAFVNCNFQMDLNDQSKRLTETLLASNVIPNITLP
jgi:hypothetical protein